MLLFAIIFKTALVVSEGYLMVAEVMDLRHIAAEEKNDNGKHQNRPHGEALHVKELRHADDPFSEGDNRDQLKPLREMRKADDTRTESSPMKNGRKAPTSTAATSSQMSRYPACSKGARIAEK